MKILLLGCAALVFLTLFSGCAAKKTTPKPEEKQYEIHAIGVLPVIPATTAAAAGTDAVNGLLAEYFRDRDDVNLLHKNMVESMNLGPALSPGEQARAVGRALNKDAVLVLTLTRYRKRDGDQYSSDNPASVAFEYQLVHTSDGEPLCAGRFDETQKSFSADILAFSTMFRRGFKWITSRQLAKEGLDKTLGTCRYLTP